MRQKYPLVSHGSSDGIIAYRGGKPVTVRRFLHDVERVSSLLLSVGYLLNACRDRYRFMVGLAAAVKVGKVSLLASIHTPGMLRTLADFAPDIYCLKDDAGFESEFPTIIYPEDLDADDPESDIAIPIINGDQTVAYVFTSGTTELPIPHRKSWGSLVVNVRAEAELLGLGNGQCHGLIGTVPPQHMYGFESTVLLAMQSGSAIVSANSFYPLDICTAISAVPHPRILVSTPFHLRFLMAEELSIPPVDLVVSATAPISMELVQEVELRFNSLLMEIYGCTESGQIASRQPAKGSEWRLFPDVRLFSEYGQIWVSGGHVEGRIALTDELDLINEDSFLLLGRHADMVNIAGNRTSLSYLNHQLNKIPGVEDGTFLVLDETSAERVTRLMAFVVAPELDDATILGLLREQIHPAFLPRPLLRVNALPRNATGKLPREALLEFARTCFNPSAPGNYVCQ